MASANTTWHGTSERILSYQPSWQPVRKRCWKVNRTASVLHRSCITSVLTNQVGVICARGVAVKSNLWVHTRRALPARIHLKLGIGSYYWFNVVLTL